MSGAAIVEELVRHALELGLEALDVDETIHDLCSESASRAVNDGAAEIEDAHEEAGARAAAINNGDLSAQVGFMVEVAGAEWARQRLAELAGSTS